ncbi:MAG TPA: delta-60 repeat domain-containing protein, partial [Tepidisphaeraceae bacterium]|nr:delta-60 repeat domain-containing protein [Tepidisphaeraceae bacterium]
MLLHPDGSVAGPYTGPTPTPPPTNVQADGKYLVVNGTSFVSGNTLTRYNPDGSVDTSFGNNGTVSDFASGTGYPAGAFNPENVTVVGNHILVGGPLNLGGEQQPSVMALVQLNPDGSIDHSFGSSGIAKGSDQATDDVKTYQMLVGPNGNYFESGEVFGFPSITEFTPAGSLVNFTELQNSGEDHVYGLGFSRNTVYLLADWTSSEVGLAAYDLNLHPDTGFGNNGVVAVTAPDHPSTQMVENTVPGPMIVDPDGRIFVSGQITYLNSPDTGGDYAIAYLPDWGANTSVSGFIYNDANGNGKRDTGETPLRYWQAFVDLNGNGVFDKYEPTAYADYNGYFKIHALDPGTYK